MDDDFDRDLYDEYTNSVGFFVGYDRPISYYEWIRDYKDNPLFRKPKWLDEED